MKFVDPKIWLIALLAALCCACGKSDTDGVPEPAPAVYYWRTTLTLDSTERAFLAEHNIKKVYLRYFDVTVGADGKIAPNATLRFADSLPPDIEVIPTVFITENCLRYDLDEFAPRIVRRVTTMTDANRVNAARELHLDCDWTERSLDDYYAFLKAVRAQLPEGYRLSATIRLHQLAMAPPPVDYGVLMVYNTGDLTDHSCPNPILDERDVVPYVKRLADYRLPLCAAYPNFGWNLLFDGTTFKAILYGEDLADSTVYYRLDPTRHLVIQSRDIYIARGAETVHLNAGDSVLSRLPAPNAIVKIHDMLAKRRPTINSQVIIYSLDSKNINNYNSKHYEKIYRP